VSLNPEKILEECRITYTLSPGPGGQRRDKKRTAVRLVHIPTGIVVVAGRKRFRSQNLREALERMASRIEERQREKKPRIPTKIPRKVKEMIREEKKKRSTKKSLRRRVSNDED
jgi:protein subunit release factor B